MREGLCAIEILVAAPSDVTRELDVVHQIADEWNRGNSRKLNAVLEVVHWTSHARPQVGKRVQDLINEQIVDSADAVVAIFKTKIGSPTGKAASGTIEEIEEFRTTGRDVLIYFSKERLPNDIDTRNLNRLKKYKKSLKETLYQEYSSPADLKRKLSVHLTQVTHQILASRKGRSVRSENKVPATRSFKRRFETLNRIQSELNVAWTYEQAQSALAKIKPLLIETVGSEKLQKIANAREHFEALVWRTAECSYPYYGVGSIKRDAVQSEMNELISDIREGLEFAEKIEALDDWEVVRFDELERKRRADTNGTALNWPEDKQCQCHACKEARVLKRRIGRDINVEFRSFVIRLILDWKQTQIDGNNPVDFLESQLHKLLRFEKLFTADRQSETASVVRDAIERLKPLTNTDLTERLLSEGTAERQKIDESFTALAVLLGPWPLIPHEEQST